MSQEEIIVGWAYSGDRDDTIIKQVTKIETEGNGKRYVHYRYLKGKKLFGKIRFEGFRKWAIRLVSHTSRKSRMVRAI